MLDGFPSGTPFKRPHERSWQRRRKRVRCGYLYPLTRFRRRAMLTDVAIRNAKPKDRPYRLRVGKGLYLEVRPTGTKLWRYRYRMPGPDGKLRENLYALGHYGKLGPGHG